MPRARHPPDLIPGPPCKWEARVRNLPSGVVTTCKEFVL
jgi:hypothetical protein